MSYNKSNDWTENGLMFFIFFLVLFVGLLYLDFDTTDFGPPALSSVDTSKWESREITLENPLEVTPFENLSQRIKLEKGERLTVTRKVIDSMAHPTLGHSITNVVGYLPNGKQVKVPYGPITREPGWFK